MGLFISTIRIFYKIVVVFCNFVIFVSLFPSIAVPILRVTTLSIFAFNFSFNAMSQYLEVSLNF